MTASHTARSTFWLSAYMFICGLVTGAALALAIVKFAFIHTGLHPILPQIH